MTNKRKPLSIKLRFEVFKRDSFKCQYCGASAPDALLQADHINPVKHGGKNDIINLITSCAKCNMGKGATPLDDNTAMAKSKKQMDELNERRQQLEMMVKWKQTLSDINSNAFSAINDLFLADGWKLDQNCISIIKAIIRKYGFEEAYDATVISIETYGLPQQVSQGSYWQVERVVRKIGGICFNRKRQRENPVYARVMYIKGICNRRFRSYDWNKILDMVILSLDRGLDIEVIVEYAKMATDEDDLFETLDWQGCMMGSKQNG